MIFLGMAFWYKETSSSFVSGRSCSAAELFNSTSDLSEEDGASDSQIGNLLRMLVRIVYLEEMLHFSLEEVFNIF
jgi:hypothetical protein